MDFLSNDINKYVADHTETEPELLQKINRETYLHVLRPRMLSGHLQGRILSLFSHLIKPKSILEIGTFTGYATLCMAEGLAEDGNIITIDNNAELTERTQAYFSESKFHKQIDMRIGEALEIIPKLEYLWNMVFIDADKLSYSHYYELVVNQCASGAIIIADNVLWNGHVIDKNVQDEDTKALRAFVKKVQKDKRVQNVLFPVRDGLMIIRKC